MFEALCVTRKSTKVEFMKGVCNCGAVSFTISGAIPAMYQCHCSLCQKQSGAGANASTIVSIDNFEWNSGKDAIKQWKKESGFNSHFCEKCGCPTPNPIGSKYMWIPVGLISGVNSKISAHLWLASKSAWDLPSEALRNYQQMPEDLEEFIQFLHSNIIT
jgi:hypothetical protein